MNILLVEDSPSDARFLVKILASWGQEKWRLHHVVRLTDALKACQESDFDIALLDLGLPDSDGWETVATFQREHPHIPIVVLTAYDDDNLALQVIAKGAQDYLVKGNFSMEIIVRSIRYSLERGRILKQLQENQRALQEKKEQLEAVFNAVPGLVLWIDKDLCYSGVNENFAKILQLSTEKIVNQSIDIVKPSADFSDFIRSFMSGEEFCHHQVISWPIYGQLCHFLIVAQKYYHNQACLVVGIDITEREEAEAKIKKTLEKERELNQMKSNFLSMVSHDFKGPLTNILMCTDFLKNFNTDVNSHPKNEFFLQAINKAVKQMSNLLDEVLLITRSESGKLTYQPSLINLQYFCYNLSEVFNVNKDEKHELDFQMVGEFSQVELDETLLNHILTNLLNNAIKYSPMGGKIQLICTDEGEEITFEIKDSGMGIPLREQEKLFDPFYRASNARGIQGTGLGLSIVKHCVELHQGEIEFNSEEGVGTTFRIKLPIKVLSDSQKSG